MGAAAFIKSGSSDAGKTEAVLKRLQIGDGFAMSSEALDEVERLVIDMPQLLLRKHTT